MLIIGDQHSRVFGGCRMISVALVWTAIQEAKLIDSMFFMPVLMFCLPVFPISAVKNKSEGCNDLDITKDSELEPLIQDVSPDCVEEVQEEPHYGGEIECDERPEAFAQTSPSAPRSAAKNSLQRNPKLRKKRIAILQGSVQSSSECKENCCTTAPRSQRKQNTFRRDMQNA